MASKRNAYVYKQYRIPAILYSTLFTVIVCVLGDDLSATRLDNLYSWHLLDTTNILQNATYNIVVSPKNLKRLLKAPSPIDIRFGINDKMPGQGLILVGSKGTLRNPENLELFYGSKIQEISIGDKNVVLKAINDWGDRITDHKFPKIFESVSEMSNLQLLIFNIFHFNETLQVDFKYSVNGLFYVDTKNVIKVPSVETTDYFEYLDSQVLDAKILRLPYSNNLSMYVFLPHTKQGIDELLNNLGYKQLKRVQWMMEETRVNVLLPKFKYHFQTNLKDSIQNHSELYKFDAAGSQFAFGHLVDKLNIFHITTISFDGNGKDDQNSKIRQARYENFHVDRPFAFYIEEDKTGDIMCIGKVLNPTT